MSNVSFLHTNIEKVQFRNISWQVNIVYDKVLFLSKTFNKLRRKHLKKVYQNLRKDTLDEHLKRKFMTVEKRLNSIFISSSGGTEFEQRRHKDLLTVYEKEVEREREALREVFKNHYLQNMLDAWSSRSIRDEDLTPDNVLSVLRLFR